MKDIRREIYYNIMDGANHDVLWGVLNLVGAYVGTPNFKGVNLMGDLYFSESWSYGIGREVGLFLGDEVKDIVFECMEDIKNEQGN